MTNLVKYDAACRALAEAKSVDEVKGIHNEAAALAAYARQAKNKDLEANAMKIRMRAERRIGELIKSQSETVGLSKGGRPPKTGLSENPVSKATLKETGIDKNLAHRARSAAAVPEEKFDEIIEESATRLKSEVARTNTKIAKAAKAAEPQLIVGTLATLIRNYDAAREDVREDFKHHYGLMKATDGLLAAYKAADVEARAELRVFMREDVKAAIAPANGKTDQFGRSHAVPGTLLKGART
jgi:hypothetical protein